jgi:hypothetical protein
METNYDVETVGKSTSLSMYGNLMMGRKKNTNNKNAGMQKNDYVENHKYASTTALTNTFPHSGSCILYSISTARAHSLALPIAVSRAVYVLTCRNKRQAEGEQGVSKSTDRQHTIETNKQLTVQYKPRAERERVSKSTVR